MILVHKDEYIVGMHKVGVNCRWEEDLGHSQYYVRAGG